jgi:hypothetical protein
MTKTIADSWARVVRSVCAQARSAYNRTLCLAQRMRYVDSISLPIFGILHKFYHQHSYMYNNSLSPSPGAYGMARYLESQCQLYNVQRIKEDGLWRIQISNAARSYTIDSG